VAVALLAVFALAAASFLMLEALLVCGTLVKWASSVALPVDDRPALAVAAGFCLPLAYVAIVVGTARVSLAPDTRKV